MMFHAVHLSSVWETYVSVPARGIVMKLDQRMQTDDDRDAAEARLLALGQEYAIYVEQTEHVAHDVEEYHDLLSQRAVVHDAIIALFDELRIPYRNRHDVRRQILQMARRGWVHTSAKT